MEAVESKPANKVAILINKQQYFIESPITGAALRALGKIPPENQLFREVPGDAPDELIRDDISYDVKPGTHFYDLPRGTVGEEIPQQIVDAAALLPQGSAARQVDGMILLRWTTRVSSLWSPDRVELVVLFPPAYPAQAPSGFDAVGDMRLNGAAPGGSGRRDVAGQACTHFCWGPAGTIDYTAPDGAWKFAKFSETRFLTLQ